MALIQEWNRLFELPEFVNLAAQVNQTMAGRTIRQGVLGKTPHKFLWCNTKSDEFERLTEGRRIGQARARGKWLFIPLDPGYVLLLGEFGGKVLHHIAGSRVPDKYHLLIRFEDGSFFSATTQMWGAIELHEAGKEQERNYIKGMRPTPVEPGFTLDYFTKLVDSLLEGEKRSVKGLLTQDQLIPGLGNAIVQDILFRSRLHPRHPISDLNRQQRRKLYDAILKTVRESIAKGGRCDEYDLYNRPGKYIRLMDSKAAGRPCPDCRTPIEKMQYLGGACYFCPRCQT